MPPEAREAFIATPGRRVVKTHLPATSMPYNSKASDAHDGAEECVGVGGARGSFMPVP